MASHFDAGFGDYLTGIINRHFDTFFPRAFDIGEQLRALGGVPQLKWMTQSWLVGLYLDCPPNAGIHCPSQEALSNFTSAIERGYITWHAFPFNAEPELYDTSLLKFGFDYTHQLDTLLNQSTKVTMSQRDVPGMTRSIIPQLLKAGVRAVTVGVNGASTSPNVPPAFVWEDPVSQKSVLAMWHPQGYGGTDFRDIVMVPGLDQALVLAWRTDNAGPPESVDEVLGTFSHIQQQFPDATVIPSTFDDFVSQLEQVRETLPVISSEIGDTWMYGVGSDPQKMAALRALQSARLECLASKACQETDAQVQNFSRFVLKSGEHTWGMDIKTFLGDKENWSNEQLRARLADGSANFAKVLESWREQRRYGIEFALQALDGASPLAQLARRELSALRPPTQPHPKAEGFIPLQAGTPFNTGRYTLGFDPASGAVTLLLDTATGQSWATPDRPIGLLQYASYDSEDYDRFFDLYISEHPPPDWAPLDFGKPNVASATPRSQVVPMQLVSLWVKANATSDRVESPVTAFLVQVTFPASLSTDYGAPAEAWIRLDVPSGSGTDAADRIAVTLSTLRQGRTRLPEALFFTFNPDPVWGSRPAGQNTAYWFADKLGEWVGAHEVQVGGSQRLHGVLSGIQVVKESPEQGDKDAAVALVVDSLDAALVCFGHPTAFPSPVDEKPDTAAAGASFVLYDNIWGTNYPAWLPFEDADADTQWRFGLTFPRSQQPEQPAQPQVGLMV